MFVYDTNAARVYSGTAALADKVDGFFIAGPSDLEALTGPQLLNLYNTVRPAGSELVKRFSDKPTAIKRVWAAAQAFEFPPAPSDEVAPKAKAKVAPAAGEPSPQSRGHNLKPKAKVYPCRAGTVQALLIDLLSRPEGVTMDELRAEQHAWAAARGKKPWMDTTLRSGLGWDVNHTKGYGVQTRITDGRVAMHLTYPPGVTAPLPHTQPKKGA